MKKISNILLLLVAFVAFSCSPDVELRDMPEALPGVEYSIDATDPNQPILTINDETVFNANWVFEDETLLQGSNVQCFYPLKGDYAFTVTAMNAKGQTIGSGFVNVPESNPSMVYGIPEFVSLCGEEGDEGKVWIWDQEEPGGDVSYMTADYDWAEFWWNPYAGDAGADLPDLLNEIKFDLEGGFNFTRYESKNEEVEKGSFTLNPKTMILKINGANIPNYNDPNLDPNVTGTGAYKIQVLNDYELLLWQDHGPNGGGAHDYGWAWKFKARDLLPLNDPLFKLAGEKGGEGRVWAFDNKSQSLGACYMTSPSDYEESWWSPYSTLESIPEYDHTIKFDLDKNYIRFDGAGVEVEAGTYEFVSKTGELTLTNAHIPNFEVRNPDEDAESNIDLTVAATGKYIVKSVDDDNLIIWQDHSPTNGGAHDYGWAWIFKSE